MNTQQPHLDEEERRILRDFERGEFESLRTFRQEKRRLEDAARKTFQKGKRINIRISDRDLERIRKRAAAEGMPYQTLISSTLHKFVTGRLTESKQDAVQRVGASETALLSEPTLAKDRDTPAEDEAWSRLQPKP